jgi:uncharacterized protein YbbK (DUF523 family)
MLDAPSYHLRRMHKILMSSCLLGELVRYNGAHCRVLDPRVARWIDEGRVVPVCPEMAGGLGTPRPPAEIVDGRVVTREGRDVTAEFRTGAEVAAATADAHGIRIAILKEASPSCGSSVVYDGTFSRTRIPGAGVTAALLRSRGIAVFSDEQLDAAAEYLATLESGL